MTFDEFIRGHVGIDSRQHRAGKMIPDRVQAVLDSAVASGAVAGVAAAVTNADGTLIEAVAGRLKIGVDALMTAESVVWIASMTKAVTTVAALQLVQAGALTLDDPIATILPDLANLNVLDGFDDVGMPSLRPAKTAITLRHLLTHTSGFSYDFANADLARYLKVTGAANAAFGLKAGLRQPLMFDPGVRWEYGIGVDWAGLAVEAASGLALDEYLTRYVTGPLGMKDTGFMPQEGAAPRRAAMHQRQPGGGLAAIPFEPRAAPEFLSGGGGLYSTLRDYQAFLRMILGKGGELLKPAMVAAMGTNQIGDLRAGRIGSANPSLMSPSDFYPGMDAKWGFGFLINPAPGPFGRSAGSLTWAGLPNCYYWIDPQRGIAAVIMMQLLPSGDMDALKTYAGFELAVYASL